MTLLTTVLSLERLGNKGGMLAEPDLVFNRVRRVVGYLVALKLRVKRLGVIWG